MGHPLLRGLLGGVNFAWQVVQHLTKRIKVLEDRLEALEFALAIEGVEDK